MILDALFHIIGSGRLTQCAWAAAAVWCVVAVLLAIYGWAYLAAVAGFFTGLQAAFAIYVYLASGAGWRVQRH